MQTMTLMELSKKLSILAEDNYSNPYETLIFPTHLSQDQWFTTPELITLHGTSHYDTLEEFQRQRLSFLEAINFYSINIHGEKALIAGLAQRIYRSDTEGLSNYLHHFLNEENRHMVYFGTFCEKYAGKLYKDRQVSFSREYEKGEEDFLFFLKVLIFEEIADYYNKKMAYDSRLNDVARKINFLHHRDETTHLIFGRKIVQELFEKYFQRWSEKIKIEIRDFISAYIQSIWKAYYNPHVYMDMGIQNPYDVAESAFAAPAQVSHREAALHRCIQFLTHLGILGRQFPNEI